MHEKPPILLLRFPSSEPDGDSARAASCRKPKRHRGPLFFLSIALAIGVNPGASAQESKRIFLPADATQVTISKIYSSTTESTQLANPRSDPYLDEYGRATHRKFFKRIPSIAVVIKYHAPSQTMTRPILRGAIEENATTSTGYRTVHFTQNLKSRSFKLRPKGLVTSFVLIEDSSHAWQRPRGGNEFQYSYGSRGPVTRKKVETLAFDIIQE